MLTFLSQNPWIIMALMSLVSFPLGVLLVALVARKAGIGAAINELLKALKSHTEAEFGVQLKISEFIAALHDLATLTRDYKENHDTRFDRIDRALLRIVASLPKRKTD